MKAEGLIGPAETHFQLGTVWRLRGDKERALAAFQKAIQADGAFVEAYLKLADLLLEMGETRKAFVYYDQALQLAPDHPKLHFRRLYLGQILKKGSAEGKSVQKRVRLKDNPKGKIRLGAQKTFSCHRGGWNLAIEALAPLHNGRGILFDSFIEDNFAWKHWREGVRPPDVLKRLMHEGGFEELATSEEKGITPYLEPWVGFLHNPQNMPHWFHFQESPQKVFSKEIWRKSLEYCQGLFCLSHYQAKWLRRITGRPVSVLIHPAEIPEVKFEFDRFLANPEKKVVQVGWWLRKLSAIYLLPIPERNPLGYQKVRLVPHFFGDADRYLRDLMKREQDLFGFDLDPRYAANTIDQQHLSNQDYDRLLSENIVFAELYDAGANNTVVECIARAAPLLVNPLPAVVEYLGEDYPMYYHTLAEAAEKLFDLELIQRTHRYLRECDTRKRLDPTYFRRRVEASEVYQSIRM
jgi:tetratricopeptide (TPR) repeat protein